VSHGVGSYLFVHEGPQRIGVDAETLGSGLEAASTRAFRGRPRR
jgi:hypothetical protein